MLGGHRRADWIEVVLIQEEAALTNQRLPWAGLAGGRWPDKDLTARYFLYQCSMLTLLSGNCLRCPAAVRCGAADDHYWSMLRALRPIVAGSAKMWQNVLESSRTIRSANCNPRLADRRPRPCALQTAVVYNNIYQKNVGSQLAQPEETCQQTENLTIETI